MSAGSDKNSILFEAWLECGGLWKKSQLYISCRHSNSKKRRGVRKWLTAKEIIAKFGQESGQAIMDRKLADPELMEKEVRDHPENPGDPNLRQFKILDLDEEVDCEEELMQHMYRVAEAGSSGSSSSSSNKKKKDKKKATKEKQRKPKKETKAIGASNCNNSHTSNL